MWSQSPGRQARIRISDAKRYGERNLDLSSLGLVELPAEIGELSSLYRLNLAGNQLKLLPPEVGGLSDLQELCVSRNRLTALPAEIERLSSLRDLDLSANLLTTLPPQIGKLPVLRSLNLSSNRLTQLVVEIGQLASLHSLLVSNNQLTELPSEIGQLACLFTLDLANCQIGNLPSQIGQLTQLRELRLYNNPLTSPEPSVVQQGTAAIVAYCAALAKMRREWRSKLLVVGEGGVGKTSLLRAMRGDPFSIGLSTTHGVELGHLDLSHPSLGGVTMQLRSWDFGGQTIYHATHQFFLTDRSVFVLVWNARHGFEQGKLYYWLDMIRARAPGSPVVIVATHVDERVAKLPLTDIQRDYPQVFGHFEVSNRLGTGIDDLQSALRTCAAALPLMGNEWPSSWLEAADGIRKLESQWVTPQDLFRRMRATGVAEHACPVLAQMLHDLGDILYFKDHHDLRDTVVLNPHWVTEHISRALESRNVVDGLGIFTRSDMDQVWCDVEEPVRRHFLCLMEAFDLSYRTPDCEEISIIVERLSPDEPNFAQRWEQFPSSNQISVRYRIDGTLPPGIPTWFIARQHRFTTHTHWLFGGLFADRRDPTIQKHLALLQAHPHDRFVELTVRGPSPANFFALLNDGFELTIARYPGLVVRRRVPCSGHGGKSCPHEFDYEDLLRRLEQRPPRETIECPKGLEDVSVGQLLWGLVPTKIEAVLKKMDQLHTQAESKRQRTMGGLQLLIDELGSLNELVHRGFLAQHRMHQESVDHRCPNTFFVFPDFKASIWPESLAGRKVKLQLCCQMPGGWHPTAQGGCYEIGQPTNWLAAMAPYLRGMIAVLKYAVPLVGPVAIAAADDIQDRVKQQLDLTKALAEKLSDMKLTTVANRLGDSDSTIASREVHGSALRYLRRWLDEVDPVGDYGGLQLVVTPEGHHLWLCEEHAKEYQIRMRVGVQAPSKVDGA